MGASPPSKEALHIEDFSCWDSGPLGKSGLFYGLSFLIPAIKCGPGTQMMHLQGLFWHEW